MSDLLSAGRVAIITDMLPDAECGQLRAHIAALEQKVKALDALEGLIRQGFWVWRLETVPVERERIRIALQNAMGVFLGNGLSLPEAILAAVEKTK